MKTRSTKTNKPIFKKIRPKEKIVSYMKESLTCIFSEKAKSWQNYDKKTTSSKNHWSFRKTIILSIMRHSITTECVLEVHLKLLKKPFGSLIAFNFNQIARE